MHELAIIRGALMPLVVLLIAWSAGAAPDTAVLAALVACAVGIVGFEVAAGIRAHLGPGEVLVEAVLGGAIGVALFGLKVLLH